MKWGRTILIALLVCSGFGWLSYFYEAKIARAEADQLRTERDAQRALIARSAFIFHQFNRITAAHEADRLKRNEATAARVVEYREILRRVPATNELVPDSVANGLCDTYARLRADTMRAASGQPDGSDSYPADPCKLTYRQAVLWLTPLLNALDEANHRFADIRAADAARSAPLTKVNK